MAETKTRQQELDELKASQKQVQDAYKAAQDALKASGAWNNRNAIRSGGMAGLRATEEQKDLVAAERDAFLANKNFDTSKIKSLESDIEAANTVARDITEGQAFGKSIVGEGLPRLGNNEDIISIRERLRNNLDSNSTENNLRKSQAIAGLGGQTQAAQRQLTSSLASSGVRGGTAAAAQLELQAGALSARSRLEENLMLQDIQNQRTALNDFSQFTSSVAQFDIGQEHREKAIEAEASLSYSNLLATERDSIRQQQAANLLAKQKQSGGKK